jgi:hypothetical protein
MKTIKLHRKNYFSYLEIFRNFETKTDREKNLIDSMLSKVKKSDSVIYLLQVDNKNIGFIAVSASKLLTDIEGIPSIEIQYLFIDKKYRKKEFKELDNIKASIFLVGLIQNIALELQTQIGIRYLILYPDKQNLSLVNFYLKLGFYKYKIIIWDNKKRETEYWMIKKL